MDFKAILLEILGLPADASDEAIAAAVEDKKKKSAAPQPEPEGGVAPLAARIDALEKRANEAEKAGILAEARAAGKVVALSADALAALTPAQLKETVDATPVTVPLSATTPAAVKEQPAPAAVDPEVGRIFALCGAEPPKPEAKA